MADLVVDVPGEHPQPDADLRCRQPGAGRVEHRVGEVLDEPAQLLVEVDHLDRALAQHRVAEESDGLDHGASLRALRDSSAVRLVIPGVWLLLKVNMC